MQGEKDSLSAHQRAIHSNIQQTETKNVQEICICIRTGSRIVEKATHLGIARNVNGKPDIDEKIRQEKAYSLMGAGFHGRRG